MPTESLLTSFNSSIISLGEHTLNTQTGELKRNDSLVKIEPQLLEFLLLLIKHKLRSESQLVTRADMVEHLWAGKNVSNDAVRAVVKKLREVLGDNARKPTYIKTIPTKGYLLIAALEVAAQGKAKWQGLLFKYGAVGLLAVLITFVFQALVRNYIAVDTPQSDQVTSKQLSNNAGVSVSADLHKNGGYLFSNYVPNENSLQLYVKSLNNDNGFRLTWDSGSNQKGQWSRDGTNILITSNEDHMNQFSVIEYSTGRSVFNSNSSQAYVDLINKEGKHLVPIAWGLESSELLLVQAAEQLFSITPMLNDHITLYRFDIKDEQLVTTIKLPISYGVVYSASVSNDGQYLALVSGSQTPNVRLAIYDLLADTMTDQIRIGVPVTKLVWNDTNDRVSFTDHSGALRSYQLSSRAIESWQGLPDGVIDLVADCGSQCFIIRQHDGDYLDIEEIPAPFNTQTISKMRIIMSDALDNFPVFGTQGEIFFVAKKSGRTMISKRGVDNHRYAVFELPGTGEIKSLSLNKSGTAFIGELEGRVFLYRMDTSVFTFVTSVNETASNPIWLSSSNGFVFTLEEKTKSSAKSNQMELSQFTIFNYELDTATKSKLGDGTQTIIEFEQSSYLVQRANGEVQIYNDSSLEQIFNFTVSADVGNIKDLAPESFSANKWQLNGNSIFYINEANQLVEFDLSSLSSKSYQLPTYSTNKNFALSADRQSLVLTRNKPTQSRLIKLDGLWQSK